MFERLKTRFIAWQHYRTTVFVLRNLDDRTLADAGISRHGIKARAAAERRAAN